MFLYHCFAFNMYEAHKLIETTVDAGTNTGVFRPGAIDSRVPLTSQTYLSLLICAPRYYCQWIIFKIKGNARGCQV